MQINEYGLSPVQQLAMIRSQMTQPVPFSSDFPIDIPAAPSLPDYPMQQEEGGAAAYERPAVTSPPSLEMTRRMLDSTLPAPGLFTMNPFSGISPDTGGITARQDGTPGAAEQGADTARQAADLYTEQLRRQAYLTAFYMPYEEQPQLFNDLL